MEDERWQQMYLAVLVAIAVAGAVVVASVWWCERQATVRTCITSGQLATCKQWKVVD